MASAWVEQHVELLLARYGQRVTLDAVGGLVGDQAVSVREIESLVDELEARGVQVDTAFGEGMAPLLGRVLQSARELRAQNTVVSVEKIARKSGMSIREVRVALLFADVLQR